MHLYRVAIFGFLFTISTSGSLSKCRKPWSVNTQLRNDAATQTTAFWLFLLLSADQPWGNGGEGLGCTFRDSVQKWKKSEREDSLPKNQERTDNLQSPSFIHFPSIGWVEKLPEKRVHEIHKPLLVLTCEALHEVMGIRIQDLSTTLSKDWVRRLLRKVQGKLEHRGWKVYCWWR